MIISKYQIFHTVAEVGSLRKASEKLNLTQSSVS
nr:LysR family transcriptional regulator [uncultured Anaeromusa sp.]